MRSRIALLVLFIAALPFFSCEEVKKQVKQEKVDKKAAKEKKAPAKPGKKVDAKKAAEPKAKKSAPTADSASE